MLADKESLIYPGIYHSSPEIKLPGEGHHRLHKSKSHVRKTETEGYIELVIELPVARREDIVVYTEHQVLSIFLIKQQKEVFAVHEIVLPGNVDPEFGCAEFKYGFLHLYFLKSNPGKTAAGKSKIIVY